LNPSSARHLQIMWVLIFHWKDLFASFWNYNFPRLSPLPNNFKPPSVLGSEVGRGWFLQFLCNKFQLLFATLLTFWTNLPLNSRC
jgi:hypothetical protein